MGSVDAARPEEPGRVALPPARRTDRVRGMDLPGEPVLRAITQRYGDLLARLGGEMGTRPLVLPNGECFPDAFTADEASAQRLIRRMQHHAGLEDVPLDAHIVDDGSTPASSSCSSGACGVPTERLGEAPRLVDHGDRWTLNVPAAELKAPVVLTTMAARALGRVFLVETADGAGVPEPVDVTADLAAVTLGFGPLLLQGAYIYSKSCGGPSVGQATRLGVSELAVATALFIALGRHAPRKALKELDTTQRAALDGAIDWAQSNDALVELLRKDPARVARGEFTLSDPRPWLLRVLGKKKGPSSADLPEDFSVADLETLAAQVGPTAAPKPRRADPKRDELRALVSEALGAADGAE
jgi:hypothetical protein